MINTVCIKTNNTEILDYLLESVEEANLESTCSSRNTFKIYENVIIHYTGNNLSAFFSTISQVLANCIVSFYERTLVRKIILGNYFYFSDAEKLEIYKSSILNLSQSNILLIKLELISKAIENYLSSNHQMVLDGFVNFRLKNYMNLLDDTVDLAVDNFLVEREYVEFVNLLKIYITSKPSKAKLIHLVYVQNEAVLLNENKEIIDTTSSMLNAKYLSDITFNSNDYALNTLLTLLPKKIKIHLSCEKDDFINTLEAIFENRISYCNSCTLCTEVLKLGKEHFYD